MGRRLRPGTATLVGLRWLASVGPATIEAWAVAMGWKQTTVYSHASRLVAAGWAESQPMTQGTGSLIYPTKAGVEIARIDATPLAAPPAPSTWAHCEACAWTGAWLTACGRQMIGPRELLACEDWHAEVQWIERGGVRHRGHRPDLVAGANGSGLLLPNRGGVDNEVHAAFACDPQPACRVDRCRKSPCRDLRLRDRQARRPRPP